jgi:hypothetical protein
MSVFDEVERSDDSPGSHSESRFAFLNRVQTPFWAEVRHLIESWFSHVAESEVADVRSRLRSDNTRVHVAAFWELYLHESLLCAGYTVMAHPPVPGTTHRPDFLVGRGEDRFYVEATVTAPTDLEVAANARRSQIYDVLNGIDSPNFFLWIDVDSEGAASPSTRRLRRDITDWLAALDPDAVTDMVERGGGLMAAPTHRWEEAGWRLAFRPIPKSVDARGEDGLRPVGAWDSGGAGVVDSETPLRSALSEKGKRYGNLEHPYIVAIQTTDGWTDDHAVTNVLYGTDVLQVSTGAEGTLTAESDRKRDGYWSGPRGWEHRNVSGVLIATNELAPWTVGTYAPTLWEHPDPSLQWTADIEHWRHARPSPSELSFVEPRARPSTVLGLDENWPGADPWQ